LRQEGVDVLHAMAFVAPLRAACPTVVTVLDLSFLRFPEAFKAFKRVYLRTMARISVRRAKRVIAISESTRQDVVSLLGVPADRVERIYCGVDPGFRPLPSVEVEEFRQGKGLPERFVLFLGTIEPRKNVETLVQAFAERIAAGVGLSRTRGSRLTDDVHLVIAGGRGWMADPVFSRVEELGVQDRVHFVGYVPEEEKPLWYNAATCFCYPSLYEGFGLPPLEAMACGVPVVTSNVSSLPEVVGEAGLSVDPLDSAEIGEALYLLLSDPDLCAERAALGLERSRQFTWVQAARQTADVYRAVGEGAG
jgi:glycosyltransferase involved in cell wall biosynthesis